MSRQRRRQSPALGRSLVRDDLGVLEIFANQFESKEAGSGSGPRRKREAGQVREAGQGPGSGSGPLLAVWASKKVA